MTTPSLVVRVAANLDELKSNLAQGVDQIEVTRQALTKMASSFDGSKIISQANATVAAISQIGGVGTLTDAEMAKVNATLTAAIDKYDSLGKTAPSAMIALANATKSGSDETSGWLGILENLGRSFVARVAEGVLLRDAIREVLGVVKEGIEAFPEMVEQSIDLGNSLFEMSMKTGASVEGLSSLRYVASQTGVDFSSFGTVLGTLEKNLGATGAAGVKVQDTLASMGLSLSQLRNEKPDDAFIAIAQALYDVGNNAEQANNAALLLGKGAKDMASMWHENIGGMLQDAQDLGLVMSTDQAAAAHLAETGFQALRLQVDALEMSISNAFIPAIIGLESDLGIGLHDAVTTLNSALGALGGDGGFLSTVARAMGTGDEAINAQVQLYNYLKDALIILGRDGIEPVVTALGFLMTEFNAFKVVTGDIMQVIQGDALAFEYLALGIAKVAAALGKSEAADDVKRIDDNIQSLLVTMKARGDALRADKQSETDWSNWTVRANKAVETAINAIGTAHTDVAVKIKEMADVSHAAYGGVQDDINVTAETAKEAAQQEREAFRTETSQLSELEVAYDAYQKAVQAGDHDTLQVQINDIDLAADAKIASLQKSKALTAETEQYIRDAADATVAHLIQKNLEADANSHDHFQLLADQAKVAFDFAMQHADQFSTEYLQKLRDTADAAQETADSWSTSFGTSLDTIKQKVTAAATSIVNTWDQAMALVAQDKGVVSGQVSGNYMLNPNSAVSLAAQAAAMGGTVAYDSYNNPYAYIPGVNAAPQSRDSGGPVMAGQPYYIGTGAQPELFIPSTSGTMIPNGAGGSTVVVHVNITQPLGTPAAIAAAVGPAVMKSLRASGVRLPVTS